MTCSETFYSHTVKVPHFECDRFCPRQGYFYDAAPEDWLQLNFPPVEWIRMLDHNAAFYSFLNKEPAMLFKLTWSNREAPY